MRIINYLTAWVLPESPRGLSMNRDRICPMDKAKKPWLGALLFLWGTPVFSQVVARGGQISAPVSGISPVLALNSIAAPLLSNAFKSPEFFSSLLNGAGVLPGGSRLNFGRGPDADNLPASEIPSLTESYLQAANDVSAVAQTESARAATLSPRRVPPPGSPRPLSQALALKAVTVSGLLAVVPDLALVSAEYTEILGKKIYDALSGGGERALGQTAAPLASALWADKAMIPSYSRGAARLAAPSAAQPVSAQAGRQAPERLWLKTGIRAEPPVPAISQARQPVVAENSSPEAMAAAEARSPWGLRSAPALSADSGLRRTAVEMSEGPSRDRVALLKMKVERQRLTLSEVPVPPAPSAALEPDAYSAFSAAPEAAAEERSIAVSALSIPGEKRVSRPAAPRFGALRESFFIEGSSGLSRSSLLLFALLPLLVLGLIRPR